MSIDIKLKIDDDIKSFGLSPFEKYLWCISNNDFLSIYSLEKDRPEKLKYNQKEIWDIKWCKKKDDDIKEDTLEFAVLHKNLSNYIKSMYAE